MSLLPSQCSACSGRTSGQGDLLCGTCWARVPRELVRAYMHQWRLKQRGAGSDEMLTAAETRMVQAAGGALRRIASPPPAPIALAPAPSSVTRVAPTGIALRCVRCARAYPRRGRPRTGRSNYCLKCETPGERIQRERKKAWWHANRGRGAQGAA